MIETNPAAENYIGNIAKHAHIEDEDYGFCYIAGTDTVYFQYQFDAEPKDNLTAEQNYYLSALTVLGMWADNQMDMTHPDPDIERFSCDLAARRICYDLDVIQNKYGLTDRAERIVGYLNNLQPRMI